MINVPKFGNWEDDDDVAYTQYFEDALKTNEKRKLKTSNHPLVNPSAFQIHQNISNISGTKKRESRIGNGLCCSPDNFPLNNPSIPSVRAVIANKLGSSSTSCERSVTTENESIFSTLGKPRMLLNVQLNGEDNDNVEDGFVLPIPRFGDWDVTNPEAGEGFTGVFEKVREERRNGMEKDSPISKFEALNVANGDGKKSSSGPSGPKSFFKVKELYFLM